MIHCLVGEVEESRVKVTQTARMKGYSPDFRLGKLDGQWSHSLIREQWRKTRFGGKLTTSIYWRPILCQALHKFL